MQGLIEEIREEMPLSQYDHGPKETAQNTIVLTLSAAGKDRQRSATLEEIQATKSNALTLRIEEQALTEALSPLPLITQANFLINDLADLLGVGATFALGGKVTQGPT